jgi:hypothetical protein
MKLSNLLAWNAFLVLSVVVARGDIMPPDPDMEFDDTACCSIPLTSSTFSFSTGTGSGIIPAGNSFQNASGVLWTSLNVSIPKSVLPDQNIGDYSCEAGDGNEPFKHCSVAFIGTNLVLTFWGVDPPEDAFDSGEIEDCCEGIPSGGDFTINLFGTGTGTTGPWPANQTFTASANVPEPGSILLLLTVLLCTWWVSAKHRARGAERIAKINYPSGRA